MKNLKNNVLSKMFATKIKGGTKINEMHRETNINRAKSASKTHNKVLQHVES